MSAIASAPIRDRIAEVVARARSEERTQWIAHVEAIDARDPVACYARLGRQDRFLWSQGETKKYALAWGIGDETESTGVDRFADVRRWMRDVRSRIEFVGETRPANAPTFFGGFGFEPESRGGDEWKAFPAARFILPALIIEDAEEGARLVSIARVDPAASTDSVEADLLALRNDALASDPTAAAHAAPPQGLRVLDGPPGSFRAGPEFNVRADRPHDVFCGQVELALEAFAKGDLE